MRREDRRVVAVLGFLRTEIEARFDHLQAFGAPVRERIEAYRRAGLVPRQKPIRGGTDGARLCFMGLPTPNLFSGQHNFHSRLEWTSAQEMEKAVEVIVELSRVWEEQA